MADAADHDLNPVQLREYVLTNRRRISQIDRGGEPDPGHPPPPGGFRNPALGLSQNPGHGESFLLNRWKAASISTLLFVGCSPRAVIRQNGPRVECLENEKGGGEFHRGAGIQSSGAPCVQRRSRGGGTGFEKISGCLLALLASFYRGAVGLLATNSFTISSRWCRDRRWTTCARPPFIS